MLTYLEIARRLRPRWVVWENVPGVLSSNGGRDFGSFLGALGELGYGWAYRVLDAQWCRTHGHPRAVPQRRRRVFVVGCLLERCAGDWERAAAVLFERESVCRDFTKKRTATKNIATNAESGAGAGCITSHDVAPCLETTCHDYTRADGFTMVAGTLGNRGLRSHTELDGHGAYVPVPFTKSKRAQSVTDDESWVNGQVNPTLSLFDQGDTRATTVAVGVDLYNQELTGGVHCPLRTAGGHGAPAVAQSMTVRRLTPRECERLQGFPDDWTLIPWRGKTADQCPDGPRSKALGNSMAVNCMEWLGERIDIIEKRNGPRV